MDADVDVGNFLRYSPLGRHLRNYDKRHYKNTLIIKVKTSIYMTDPTVEEDDLRDYWRLKSDKLSHAQYPQEDDRDR